VIAKDFKGDIAVDYDGTLAEPTAHKRFLDYLELVEVSCNKKTLQETGDYCRATGISNVVIDRHYANYLRSHMYRAPNPVPGAIKATRELCGSFRLHIVTSRATQVEVITRKEIQGSYPCTFTSFNFGAGGAKKAEIVSELRAFLHIDDAPDHAVRVADVASVILMPGPGQRREQFDPRFVIPKAHKLVAAGMSDKDWQKVWRKTWEEIPHLVRDIRAKQTQTQVPVP
jgi:hypothetical protein